MHVRCFVLSLGCAAICGPLFNYVTCCSLLRSAAGSCRGWKSSVITLSYGGVLGVYGQVAVEVLSASVLVARGVGVPGVVQ